MDVKSDAESGEDHQGIGDKDTSSVGSGSKNPQL